MGSERAIGGHLNAHPKSSKVFCFFFSKKMLLPSVSQHPEARHAQSLRNCYRIGLRRSSLQASTK